MPWPIQALQQIDDFIAATSLAGIMTPMLGHVSPWFFAAYTKSRKETALNSDDMLAGQALLAWVVRVRTSP
jgi:hypothetical protein